MDGCGRHEVAVFGHICHARMAAEKRAEDQRTEAIERAKRARELMAWQAEMATDWHCNRGYVGV